MPKPDAFSILSELSLPEVAATSSEAYFGGIDYAPQKLGEQTFWLATRFYTHDAKNTGRMLATYSNGHRYIGELKILPSASTTETQSNQRNF